MNEYQAGTIVGGLDEAQRLRALYGLTDEDLARIRAYGELVVPRIDEFVATFYQWMETLPEFDEYYPAQKEHYQG